MWSKYFVLEKEAIINKVCVLCMPLFTSKTPRHLIFPSAPSDAAGQRRTAPFSPSRKRRLVSRKKGEGKNIMHIKGSEESNAPAKRRGKGKEGGRGGEPPPLLPPLSSLFYSVSAFFHGAPSTPQISGIFIWEKGLGDYFCSLFDNTPCDVQKDSFALSPPFLASGVGVGGRGKSLKN